MSNYYPAPVIPTDISNEDEHLLQTSPYWITVSVRAGECYRLSGYVRSQPDENRDAALILFDFGSYDMDEFKSNLSVFQKNELK